MSLLLSDETEWSQWQRVCQENGLLVKPEQRAQFQQYYTLLQEKNAVMNLTSIKSLHDFLYRHLLDSLVLLPYLPGIATLADVGSGAGFPAIPLTIASTGLTVTAIEATGKKTAFLNEVKNSLQLTRLSVLNQRSEEVCKGSQHSEEVCKGSQHREYYDVVTARAVARLSTLLELCLPLVRVGGQFFAMKGLQFEQELDEAEEAMDILGAQLCDVLEFDHELLKNAKVLIFKKIFKTPAKYPRNSGMPLKKPL